MARKAQAYHEGAGFAAFMASSRRGVLSLSLADVLLKGPFARARMRFFGLILLASVPALLHLATLPFSQCSIASLGWIGYFTLLLFLLFLFPHWAWTELVGCSEAIEAMLPSREDSERLIRTMRRILGLGRQSAIALPVGVASVVLFWMLRMQVGKAVEICAVSYVLVFLVASLGINGVYWLWSVPVFIASLLRVERLNLWWHAPAHTPGIRRLSRLLGASALMAGIGVVLFEIPILFVAQRLKMQGLLGIVYFGGLLATLTTFLFVAVYPQICLSRLGVREKRRVLQEIGEQLHAQRTVLLDKTAQASDELGARVQLYDRLVSAPAATVAPGAILRFLTGLGTALLPYILKALGWTL